MTEIGEGRKIWIDALRSGDYQQGQCKLGDPEVGMCCLGLACHLAVEHGIIEQYDPARRTLKEYGKVKEWIGLNNADGHYRDSEKEPQSLASDNDKGISFAGIADIVERDPEYLLRTM